MPGGGGPRNGAGRPRGAPDRGVRVRTCQRKAPVRLVRPEDGVLPIDLMLLAMRDHWAQREALREEYLSLVSVGGDPESRAVKSVTDGIASHTASAVSIAEKAAPYVHPRLQAVQHTGAGGGAIELAVALAEGRRRALGAVSQTVPDTPGVPVAALVTPGASAQAITGAVGVAWGEARTVVVPARTKGIGDSW